MTLDVARTVDDEENAAALRALSSQGRENLGTFAPLHRRMSQCPHCHQGFGSASLQIHIPRCRALIPDPEAEAAAAEAAAAAAAAAKKVKKRQVPSLVNLCLQFLSRNFKAMCIDKVMVAPEHEAALIDALPTDLVHRLITNLVFDNRQIAEKGDKQRTKVRLLQKELEELKVQRGQLETFRHQASVYRSRMTAQDHIIESLTRDVESMSREKTVAEQQLAQLLAQFAALQKTQTRLESRVQLLTNENDKLKTEVRDARKKEMSAMKLLASSAKSGKPVNSGQLQPVQDVSTGETVKPRAAKRPSTSNLQFIKPRPRTEGSKIPFPSRLPPEYSARCIPVTK